MSLSDLLATNLDDISDGLTSSLLTEQKKEEGGEDGSEGKKRPTASRELLETKRKCREDDEEITTQEEYIPLVKVSRKRQRAAESYRSDPLLSSIAQEGACFSINDTSFHNANKNAKVITKAKRKKLTKGSNYSDKLNARKSRKNKLGRK